MKNQAAWIPKAKARLEVDDAPYPDLVGPDDVVIRNYALAINPVDWKIQDSGGFVSNYPNILGEDVAGIVVKVGSNVKNLKKGQRVLGHAIRHALGLRTGNPRNGAFQLFPVLSDITIATIPDSLSFKDASVLPLSLSTASTGLYLQDLLGLPLPNKGLASKGTTLLVWGGSSSIGSTTIQLAVASGLIVVSTASTRNFDYVKSLGAQFVFDYHRDSIEDDLIKVLRGSKLAGAYDAIGLNQTVHSCVKVVHELGGGKVATVLQPPKDVPDDVKVLSGKLWLEPEKRCKPAHAFDLVQANQLITKEPTTAKIIYHSFVPEALADGRLKARPEALVVGVGLSSVQAGLDRQKEGVSARKVVVLL